MQDVSVDVLAHPKLKEANYIRVLIEGLSDELSQGIKYGALEGEVLVFYVMHPAFIVEFDRKKQNYLAELRALYVKHELKGKLYFTDIKAKHKVIGSSNKQRVKMEPDRATGEFEICASNSALANAFKKIQEQIKANNKKAKEME